MNEDLQMVLDMTKEAMQKSLDHLESELTKIRAGKATPSMLDSVQVEAYGSNVPISQVANIGTLDARTLTIQPWDKSMIDPIERGIINANLGLAPSNNGESIIINIPALTEERRKDLVKQARAAAEHDRVGIRNARKTANDEVKALEKDGLSEDSAKDAISNIQKLTDSFIAKVDAVVTAKESDIMKV